MCSELLWFQFCNNLVESLWESFSPI